MCLTIPIRANLFYGKEGKLGANRTVKCAHGTTSKFGKECRALPDLRTALHKRNIESTEKQKRKVHFATLMDICHLKNAELNSKYQKYKGRVVLRGDIVKDDSGSYAVFTEQASSASQMTAAKVMDIISILPGCAGQPADAVSAYTQVKIEDAPTLLKIPKSECPDIWIRLPRNNWPKSWANIEDQVVPLERHLFGHPLAGLLWERVSSRKSYWDLEGIKYRIGNVYLFMKKKTKDYSYRKNVDDIKMAGKNRIQLPYGGSC